MINIAIVEDDSFIRESLQEFIDAVDNMRLVASKDSVEAFLYWLNDNNKPDIILMDIGLPGMSGISGIKLIKEKYPGINILMLTIYNDSHRIFQSLCAGASGYLLKNTPFSEIKEAIEIIHNGGSSMSPQIARKVIDYFHSDKTGQVVSPLTIKE
jgi:DNA-binding NarL/FixJ family response regulator